MKQNAVEPGRWRVAIACWESSCLRWGHSIECKTRQKVGVGGCSWEEQRKLQSRYIVWEKNKHKLKIKFLVIPSQKQKWRFSQWWAKSGKVNFTFGQDTPDRAQEQESGRMLSSWFCQDCIASSLCSWVCQGSRGEFQVWSPFAVSEFKSRCLCSSLPRLRKSLLLCTSDLVWIYSYFLIVDWFLFSSQLHEQSRNSQIHCSGHQCRWEKSRLWLASPDYSHMKCRLVFGHRFHIPPNFCFSRCLCMAAMLTLELVVRAVKWEALSAHCPALEREWNLNFMTTFVITDMGKRVPCLFLADLFCASYLNHDGLPILKMSMLALGF